MASVALQSIGKSFAGVPVLRDINLDIADGEFLTLVGASGCGKSTLIRIIAGLEPQSTGTVLIGGVRVVPVLPVFRQLLGGIRASWGVITGSVRGLAGVCRVGISRIGGTQWLGGLVPVTSW